MDNDTEAKGIIDLDGADGYATAANLVGPDRADELLAELVKKNMCNEGYTPKEGEVERIVAKTRKRKGF